MKTHNLFLATVTVLVLLAIPINVLALTYDVNRSFSDGSDNATLVGTLDIALGNYTLTGGSASPFTDVDLTLTVTSISGIFSYNLVNALTDYILGTGQFSINATATELIFSASGNASNPADLIFSDNTNPASHNRYSIGSNGNPHFEVAYTDGGDVRSSDVAFPVLFGRVSTSVPEPATMLLLGSGLIGLWGLRRKFQK